jgi:hypothetical protein
MDGKLLYGVWRMNYELASLEEFELFEMLGRLEQTITGMKSILDRVSGGQKCLSLIPL